MKSSEIIGDTIAFGAFRLEAGRRRVVRIATGEPLAITGRPFEALYYLVSRPGVLIPKAELFRAVWKGISVEDNSLARCISTIRKLLEDAPKNREYIVTEPGLGYRFVAPVVFSRKAIHSGIENLSPNLEAQSLYASALSLLSRPGSTTIPKAIEKLKAAILMAPSFALAHTALANANVLLGVFGLDAPLNVFPKARAAAMKALGLNGDLADAHLQMGHIASMFELNRHDADRYLRRALELDQRSAMTYHHMALQSMASGQFDDALARMQRAMDLQPLAANIRANIGMILYYAGKYEAAMDQLEATLEIADFAHARSLLGRCWLRVGQPEKALGQFNLRTEGCIGSMADIPVALAFAGRLDESNAKLDEMMAGRRTGYVSAYDLATVCAAQRHDTLALAWLEVALEERAQPIIALGIDPAFTSLAQDARFSALARRVQH